MHCYFATELSDAILNPIMALVSGSGTSGVNSQKKKLNGLNFIAFKKTYPPNFHLKRGQ